MAVYLVTWDLNQERNYPVARAQIVNHLQRYPHIVDLGLDSLWFIESNASVEQVYADIGMVFDQNDRLMITRLVNPYFKGWLNQTVVNWINARL